MKPSDFARLLFGDEPPGFLQVWELDTKHSYYPRYPNGVDYYADGKTDVYLAVGLAHRAHARKARARADQIIGIPGLWLDLDVNGGPDNKKGAAPDWDAALAIAREIVQPTCIVHSGYGLHAWYLLAGGPWRFRSRAEQQQAALASAQWYALHRAKARERGWTIDGTHDLSRLLRPPGTLNGKGGDRRSVRLVFESPQRHDREQLLQIAAQAGDVLVDQRTIAGDDDGIPSDLPVADRLRALLENVPEFADTWRHTRADALGWSTSEYDLAVAAFLVDAEWTNSDIAVAITLHRRRHDANDPKAHRVDYLQRTITKARTRSERVNAAEQLRLLAEGQAA